MQFSESWLRTLVDPSLNTAELVHLLTMSGLEVETCEDVAPPFTRVVVARIVEVARHPNADRLTLCRVDAGIGVDLPIVCGAPNVAVGMKVPCALVGALLPGDGDGKSFEIKVAKMRGVESQGMLCSARELGLSDDHSGLLSLPADAPIGADFRDYYGLDDKIITVKLTPNRADCLSVLGVAREVSALTRAPLHAPEISPVPAVIEETFPFSISATDGCGRFTGRVIRGVDANAPTPDWMKQRLERAGQRSISALVDVTNYVMLELGRPLHVYDLDKVRGGIDVRFGRKGESVKLLNEQTVEVDESVLCITDDSGPIGLAGIMGGDSTKADLGTRNVFLESAFFFPEIIAGRARRFNFSSDAAHRFERGVDFENNVAGIERATRLILDICGGKAGPTEDTIARLPERRPVLMRVARAQKIIGVPVPADEIADIFHRLGFASSREGAGAVEVFVATPPTFRFDISIEEDLIEEVARIHGFERIPAHPPVAPAQMRTELEARRSLHTVRHQLAARGYHEVINFSFVEEAWESDLAGNSNPIRLLNPIASQLAVMRSSLMGSLIANVRHNANRKISQIRLFEVGRVFKRNAAIKDGELEVAGLEQPTKIGGIAFGSAVDEQWGEANRRVDFFDVKGDVEALLLPKIARFESGAHPALHPGRAAKVILDGNVIGWIGELHPAWQQKYDLPSPPVLFELDASPVLALDLPRFAEVSKFPPVIRDLAVLVPDAVPAQALLEALSGARITVVQEVRLFDLYRGKGVPEGQKSLAFRVVIQDTAKTLTDDEADAAMAQLTQVLAEKFGARLRA